jgi:hypothetical protein
MKCPHHPVTERETTSTLVNRSLVTRKWKRRNNQIPRIIRLCEGPISTNYKHITDNEGTNDGQTGKKSHYLDNQDLILFLERSVFRGEIMAGNWILDDLVVVAATRCRYCAQNSATGKTSRGLLSKIFVSVH